MGAIRAVSTRLKDEPAGAASMGASGFGTMKSAKVRYNPGNLGDLLKHGWLVEIVRFLHRHGAGRPLRYADTFCGFPEYDIGSEFAERIRERFHVLNFRRLQEPFLARGKYAGSVTLAGLAAEGRLRPCIYDIDPGALASFPAGQTEVLALTSGCDILEAGDPYDLIFLDPYDDVRDGCGRVLARAAARSRGASILIFLPFRDEARGESIAAEVQRQGTHCLTGIVHNPGSPLDGRHHFAAVFIPAATINPGAVLGLFGELNVVTARVNALATLPEPMRAQSRHEGEASGNPSTGRPR